MRTAPESAQPDPSVLEALYGKEPQQVLEMLRFLKTRRDNIDKLIQLLEVERAMSKLTHT